MLFGFLVGSESRTVALLELDPSSDRLTRHNRPVLLEMLACLSELEYLLGEPSAASRVVLKYLPSPRFYFLD